MRRTKMPFETYVVCSVIVLVVIASWNEKKERE